ncbi:MAG: WG repeat-containing protein [Chitinophaga sp.]|uniref:WG repeat-containing protein n=1 Tax=Chitinophaga sp. TaxID=1869181 RepID=UPI001B2070B6|nr:WG repeat-containing protein [Chitinophaga sp.]MBO9727101.1 WG repeat-containing protein [Chitinophaga sp.]
MKQYFCLLLTFIAVQCIAQSRKFPYYNGSKWGLVNDSVQEMVPPKYDAEFWIFRDKIAIVQQGGLYGSIGTDGSTVLPCRYDSIFIIKGFTAAAGLKHKFRLVDISTGKELSGVEFNKWGESRHDRPAILPVNIGKKWYFMNMVTGQLISKQGYDEVGFVTTGYYEGMIRQGNKYGVLDLATGALIAPVQYDHLVYRSQGTFDAIAGENVTFYTADGKSRPGNAAALTQNQQAPTAAATFNDAPVSDEPYIGYMSMYVAKGQGGDWRVTYEKRNYLSAPVKPASEFLLKGYTSVEKFYYDETLQPKALLKVTQNGKTGLVTPEGEVMLPCIYDSIRNEGGYYVPQVAGKEGVIKTNWKVLSPPVLKRVYRANYEAAAYLVEMPDGKKGYMDMYNGKIYIPETAR